MANVIEQSFPKDGDLVAAILEGIAAHGLAPVTAGTAVDAYPQGRYWSVCAALNRARDVLWLAPLVAPQSFTNFDHTDKTAIAVMPTLALHLDYDEQLSHLAQVMRDAAERLAGAADAAPIPFFLMDAHEVVSPCGVALLGKGRQHVVLQGMRGASIELVVVHDQGVSTVTADSYSDFGRATHWSWADIADITATPTWLTVKFFSAPAPQLWQLGMGARPADARDFEALKNARAEHRVMQPVAPLRSFSSDAERAAELAAVCSAIRVPANFDAAGLLERYGERFVVDVLRKLPRNLYFAGYARPVIAHLLADDAPDRAREVAELAPPASRTATFSPLVIHALARRDHTAALALIADVEQASPAGTKGLPGHWLLWKLASLMALGRLSEARRIRESVREYDDGDPFVHLALACTDKPAERHQALTQALRFGLERLDPERQGWVTACGFTADHPITVCVEGAATQRHRAQEMARLATAAAATHPVVFGNEVDLDALQPARSSGVRLNPTLRARVELPISNTYISNLAASRDGCLVRLGDGRLLAAVRDAQGSLEVRATVPGPYHAPGASALAFQSQTLLLADEQRGLVVIDASNIEDPREVACIPPRRSRGFSSLAVHGNRIAAFAGEALELFLDMAAPRSHQAFDLPHDIGGAVWCGERLIVSAGALLVSIASNADDARVIDALRLTSETIDAGPAFCIGECVYALAGPGVWRARVAADGSLTNEGWLPLPFALRPTRVRMRATARGVLIGDVAFDRHVTLLTGPESPLALIATARMPGIEDYFSATAWMGDALVGAGSRELFVIEVGSVTR